MVSSNRRTNRIQRNRQSSGGATPVGSTRLRRSQVNSGTHRRSAGGRMPSWVQSALVNDHRFQLLASDGSWWLNPFTGQPVSVMDPWQDSVVQHLAETAPWNNNELKDVQQLEMMRWMHEVQSQVSNEPRLRLFGPQGSGWMNPYSGDFYSHIKLDNGRFSPVVLNK